MDSGWSAMVSVLVAFFDIYFSPSDLRDFRTFFSSYIPSAGYLKFLMGGQWKWRGKGNRGCGVATKLDFDSPDIGVRHSPPSRYCIMENRSRPQARCGSRPGKLLL